MKIKINHIARIEGHAGFVGKIVDGHVKDARFEIEQGARLIEGILVGRHYEDAPLITARICGICPVIHNITALKALEAALGVKVGEQTISLRKLLLYAQLIHSHGLHLFFLSLPDFFDLANDFTLVKKYPDETNRALLVRDFGVKTIEYIAGRTIHPLTTTIGGFLKLPTKDELAELYLMSERALTDAIELVKLFKKIKYPNLERKTEYISLHDKKEYALYEGNIVSTGGLDIPAKKFEKNIKEITKPYEVVRKIKYKGQSFMVGAIARLNNNWQQLNPLAKKELGGLSKQMPIYNPFYNILAQMIEVVHFIEESKKILGELKKKELKLDNKKYSLKAGWGVAACEAPRGTLYHAYKLNSLGFIDDCQIITPTAQMLSNIEDDLKKYIPLTFKFNKKARQARIRALIRAYDPCIACATH